ncbi:orotate phosphoribosyltransferase [Eikenella sp. NML96-A-049]|uniref:orotate phosphoribosyltransferase n=1 Tax=Eikenella sp. NML96-A-049 TaxID=1809061 RepID=UPI0007DF958D|nr:orotate phosphoribosyltransferase [Eikenella sp. NML96-A-049]OAM40706.1 orotate phosphoribosyltransferase [Eikenella sp. NML96-A-049]
MSDFRQDFLRFALEQDVLRFGEFVTKAGRLSPYFFNAGLFNDGASTLALARFSARSILESGVEFDMLFGPAYKGIVLASATAMMLAEAGRNVPFAYNRKEAKDHGEGGTLVGAPLAGRVLIIDDVISAGTSVRESVRLIEQAGATPAGVAIALDRMEKGTGSQSAVQEVRRQYGLPVVPIASLADLLALLQGDAQFRQYLAPVQAYRDRYGVAD